jgi:hypothetical protein
VSISGVRIIGKGNIGEKARQLIQKGPELQKIGFKLAPMTVLAEDFFDGFFKANNIGPTLQKIEADPAFQNMIMRGKFSEDYVQAIAKISGEFGNLPLAVRSSEEGTARGIGIYTTWCCNNSPAHVQLAIRKVLASYFSESAIAFRKASNHKPGFAIMIQPLIGKMIRNQVFAPVFSGYGYTSTIRNQGYVNIVPGLFGAGNSRVGEVIVNGSFEPHETILHYIMLKSLEEKDDVNSSAIMQDIDCKMGNHMYRGYAYNYDWREVCETYLNYDHVLSEKIDNVDLSEIFQKIKSMESEFGKPQYFEWALTIGENPEYWITQIADVDREVDAYDFSYIGRSILNARKILLSGERRCDRLIYCNNEAAINILNLLNKGIQNYILLYDGSLVSAGNINVMGEKRLDFDKCYNASVIIENRNIHHLHDIMDHWGTKFIEAKKLFGVATPNDVRHNILHRLEGKLNNEHGLLIYKGNFKVLASRRQDKMVVIDESEK